MFPFRCIIIKQIGKYNFPNETLDIRSMESKNG